MRTTITLKTLKRQPDSLLFVLNNTNLSAAKFGNKPGEMVEGFKLLIERRPPCGKLLQM